MSDHVVGILLFDGVELLDFAGPFEVFTAARLANEATTASWREAHSPFRVTTIAKEQRTLTSTGGLRIEPAHDFESAPKIDILVVPGGAGVRSIIGEPDDATLDWTRRVSAGSTLTTSVCTGAWVLARAGLLQGRRATTHFLCTDMLAQIDPTIVIERDQRIVDDGIITAAGVAAGIDMALYVVEKLCGRGAADATAKYIQYPRSAHAEPGV